MLFVASTIHTGATPGVAPLPVSVLPALAPNVGVVTRRRSKPAAAFRVPAAAEVTITLPRWVPRTMSVTSRIALPELVRVNCNVPLPSPAVTVPIFS